MTTDGAIAWAGIPAWRRNARTRSTSVRRRRAAGAAVGASLLTVSDQRQMAPAWSPDGKWIAYQSDYDGDEQWDIFFVSPKTGQVVNVTNTREVAELRPTWSPNGRYVAYMVKPKTSSVYEIDVFDTLMRQTLIEHPSPMAGSKPVTSAVSMKKDFLDFTDVRRI